MAETKRALVVVRTYPSPAKKGVETSCTAAITEAGEWLRLFPIPYRLLKPEQKFKKYQWIDVTVAKSSDDRPESFKLFGETPIRVVSEVLPTEHEWQARKSIVFPLVAKSLCVLVRERRAKKFPTLGIFRPKTIRGLSIEADDPDWSEAQLATLRQGDLFGQVPDEELQKIPHKFIYRFDCDDEDCNGHNISCTDWEMSEAWRKWKDQYGDGWEVKFRQKFEAEMIDKYDTYFYVGTLRAHPDNWIIVGLFYPPRPGVSPQGTLFDE